MKQRFVFYSFLIFVIIVAGCSKGTDNPGGRNDGSGGNNGSGNSGGTENSTCLVSSISQVNSGKGAESSLSLSYNNQYVVTKITVYDSVSKTTRFTADLNYITADSVRINAYQYLKLDAAGRVVRFVTKSDLNHIAIADDYVFTYAYNADSLLTTKNLFINGSKTVNYSTTYTYTNRLLTECILTAPSSGTHIILESTLNYNNTVSAKNWMYTFPDAMEGYIYLAALNFGRRPDHPLQEAITKIYDPASGALLDTWTTHYGNYRANADGYLLSGETTGDLQQGMAAFYGKTNFYYACH